MNVIARQVALVTKLTWIPRMIWLVFASYCNELKKILAASPTKTMLTGETSKASRKMNPDMNCFSFYIMDEYLDHRIFTI